MALDRKINASDCDFGMHEYDRPQQVESDRGLRVTVNHAFRLGRQGSCVLTAALSPPEVLDLISSDPSEWQHARITALD